MEHQPQSGRKDRLSTNEATAAAEREELIREGLDRARRTGGRIDHLTAKRIARELDPGDGPLHEFFETGVIRDDMEADLVTAEEVVEDLELETHVPWIAALRDYVDARLIRTALPGWNEPGME